MYDWASYGYGGFQVIACQRDDVIAVQFFPSNKICRFVGSPMPEHKKRVWYEDDYEPRVDGRAFEWVPIGVALAQVAGKLKACA